MHDESRPQSPRLETEVEALLGGFNPRLKRDLADLRALVVEATAPVAEYIFREVDVLLFKFTKASFYSGVFCQIKVADDAIYLSLAGSFMPPRRFDTGCLEYGRGGRWQFSRAVAESAKRVLLPCKLARTKQRRPGGRRTQPEGVELEPPLGSVQLMHPLPDDVRCSICGARVLLANLNKHLMRHAEFDEHGSVWTISGGGGPGTGKRR